MTRTGLAFGLVISWSLALEVHGQHTANPVPAEVTVAAERINHCDPDDRWLNWDTHPRPGCCGSGSPYPAVQTELYFRTGPSFVVGSGTYSDSLSTGWTFQGGAKAMFFNEFMDTAWYVDASISNHHNSANSTPATVTLLIDDPVSALIPPTPTPATIRGLNRTFVNLGLGRALYLWAPANACSSSWRICFDGGGRYGSAKADFFEITYESDVIGGLYAGLQTDLDIPWGRCLMHLGCRLEYAYTWSDVLQRQSDMQDINVLFQVGVRY